MQRKHILITGASGTVGSEILKLITQFPEYQITCFDIVNKKNKKFFNQYKNKIQWITGDISNESEVKKIPSQIDVVIHLAALIPPSADLYPHLTQKINVLGTKLLLNHLEKTSPQVFFIYSSSIALYGDRVENPYIRVSDPIKISEGDYYAETKMAAEQLVQQSSLRWSIFRLAAIMKNHKISKLMFHMPLKTHFEICTPNDTANAFVKAISNQEQLQFRIFNLGGGEKSRTSYQKFLENSFKIYGLGRLDFPENSFATKNFHCGYLADGDDLENILHFRNDTLKSYYHTTQASFPLYKKLAASLFSKIIKYYLLKQSEPYQAYKSDNQEMMQRFFKKIPNQNIHLKMKKRIKIALPFLILFFNSLISNAQLIILKISNIKSSQGQMCIAFFENQKQFSAEKPVHTLHIPKNTIVNGSLTVKIPYKRGNYGISVLDDENGNGKMNYKLLSIPTEGFGFSNYYHKGILKPTIQDFKFQIDENETKEIYVKLRYMD